MVAAGNDGPNTCTIGSPGDAKDVITVGAMADLGANGFKQADFSGRGPTVDGRIKPDITAPGVGITAAEANTGSGYISMNGTSMATPFVTGVALLMIDANPAFTMDDIKDTIRGTAVDWGRGGRQHRARRQRPGRGLRRRPPRRLRRAGLRRDAADPDAPFTSPPAMPEHALREGSLSGTGQVLEYAVDVADTTNPVAATLIQVTTACRTGANPDFDMRLLAPERHGRGQRRPGRSARTSSATSRRVAGVYKLRVYSFRDCGDFFVDVSGGTVSSVATSNPDEDKGDDATPAPATPTTPEPAAPGPSGDAVAFAAVADAARSTARRAISARALGRPAPPAAPRPLHLRRADVRRRQGRDRRADAPSRPQRDRRSRDPQGHARRQAAPERRS